MPIRFDHPRTVWQDPNLPVRSSSLFEWSDVDQIVVHYTAADNLIDGDPGESADRLDDYLRSIQRYYVEQRGYSIGYNAAVDWLGGSWQLRGEDFECAANRATNNRSFAILVLVDGNDEATPEAVNTIRRLYWEADALSPLALTLIGHGQTAGASTSCPGDGLRRQIAAGVFTQALTPTPPVKRRTLRLSQRPQGDDVKIVQARVKVTPDGDYGPVTAKAVQGFKGFMMRHTKPNTTWGSGAWRVHDWLTGLNK